MLDGEFNVVKIGEAKLPKGLFGESAAALLQIVTDVLAPVTASTAGIGRWIAQKFETKVQIEQALAVVAIQEAVQRAVAKAGRLLPPPHPKSFIRAIEEVSLETDPTLREMWTNLLASQMSGGEGHPHFVEILAHLSPEEAHLFLELRPRSELGNIGSFVGSAHEGHRAFLLFDGDTAIRPWTLGCHVLCDLRLANTAPFHLYEKGGITPGKERGKVFLFRTKIGDAFLATVSKLHNKDHVGNEVPR
ncbi:MAG: Abi-alpha family protein [Limisphaerales bacterium]